MLELLKSANAAEQAIAAGAATAGTAGMLQLFGVDPGVAIAAALGAVGLLAFDSKIPPRQAVPAVLLGFAVGTYGAVPFVEWRGLPPSSRYIVAVVLGLIGYFLLGGAIAWAKKKFIKDPVNAIKELKQ